MDRHVPVSVHGDPVSIGGDGMTHPHRRCVMSPRVQSVTIMNASSNVPILAMTSFGTLERMLLYTVQTYPEFPILASSCMVAVSCGEHIRCACMIP